MNLSLEISSSLRHAASVIQSAYAQAYWLPTNQRRDKAARNVRYASNSDRILRRSETTLCVESRCGAVALGRTYLLPPLSSGGALMVPPWLRFHIPLIEPDRQISRIRLSDKTSRLHFRVQRLLQFLNTHRSL